MTTNINKIIRRDGIYLPRVWWWYPWTMTRPWLPRVFIGDDEWCNRPLAVVLPPVGCLLFFQFWRPLRTMPCVECWSVMSDEQRADYLPGGVLCCG